MLSDFLQMALSTIPSVTQCPVYNVCDSLDWEDVLSDNEHSDTLAHAEISRLTQLLAQRDAELSQKDAELAQKETEIAQLVLLLSQRDEESVRNSTVLNSVMQELLGTEQELVQRDTELAQTKSQIVKLQKFIRDLTIVKPIDVHVKLGEMFESWKCDAPHFANYPSCGQLDEVAAKIYAATEHIKEPIMDLFHVAYTYVDYSRGNDCVTIINATAFILTASDVYRLTYSSRGSQDYPTIVINSSMDMYVHSYKWVKVGSMDRSINRKTLRKYITTTSGSTGFIQTNSNYPSSGSGDKIAEQLIKNMLALVM